MKELTAFGLELDTWASLSPDGACEWGVDLPTSFGYNIFIVKGEHQ